MDVSIGLNNATNNDYYTDLYIAVWLDLDIDATIDVEELYFYPLFTITPIPLGPFWCTAGMHVPMISFFSVYFPEPLPTLEGAWFAVLLEHSGGMVVGNLAEAPFSLR